MPDLTNIGLEHQVDDPQDADRPDLAVVGLQHQGDVPEAIEAILEVGEALKGEKIVLCTFFMCRDRFDLPEVVLWSGHDARQLSPGPLQHQEGLPDVCDRLPDAEDMIFAAERVFQVGKSGRGGSASRRGTLIRLTRPSTGPPPQGGRS